KDLLAWQRAMDLAHATYVAVRAFPPDEKFGLARQLRRAAASVPANIAEGQGRKSPGAFLNHLSISLGSLCELETDLLLASRLQYLTPAVVSELKSKAAEVGRLINGLARSERAKRW